MSYGLESELFYYLGQPQNFIGEVFLTVLGAFFIMLLLCLAFYAALTIVDIFLEQLK